MGSGVSFSLGADGLNGGESPGSASTSRCLEGVWKALARRGAGNLRGRASPGPDSANFDLRPTPRPTDFNGLNGGGLALFANG